MTDTVRLRQRVDRLVDDGRWADVRDLLAPVAPRDLVRAGLAYRYGEALYFTGRISDLERHAEAYEMAARADVDLTDALRARNLAGIAAFELGNMERAEAILETVLDRAAAEGESGLIARAAISLGALANLRGDPARALGYYRAALTVFERLDEIRGMCQAHHNLGMSYRDLGRLADAAEEYRLAARAARHNGLRPLLAMSLVGRGEVETMAGDPDLGVELAQRGHDLAVEIDDPITRGTALRVRAVANLARGEHAAAGDRLRKAAAIADETGNALLAAEVDRDLGRLHQVRGELEPAIQQLERAHERFVALGASGAATGIAEQLDALRQDL